MVRGQLHALGTKQHIKSKFGRGYEIAVRMALGGVGTAANQRADAVVAFIKQRFPCAVLLNANAGLLTFRIDPQLASIGRLFEELGSSTKAGKLGVADFSVSQPTLEQCFIRVVAADATAAKASSAVNGIKIGGGAVPAGAGAGALPVAVAIGNGADTGSSLPLSLQQHVLLPEDDLGDDDDALGGAAAGGEVNCCGCRQQQVLLPAYFCLFLFVVMVFVALGGRNSSSTRFAGPVSTFALIFTWVLCCVAYCPCCRVGKKGLEE